MTIKNKIKTAIVVGVTTLLLALPGKAKAEPASGNVNTRVVYTQEDVVSQSWVGWGANNRALIETSPTGNAYGVNYETDLENGLHVRGNVGYLDSEGHDSDQGRILGSLARQEGILREVGFEYNHLKNTEENERIIGIAKFVLHDKIRAEATVDNNKSWRAIGFYEFGPENPLVSLGVGQNSDGSLRGSATFSTKILDDPCYCARARAIISEDGFRDFRLRMGPGIKREGEGVDRGNISEITAIGDLDDPFKLGPYDLFSSMASTGEKGDIGIEARHLEFAKNQGRQVVKADINIGDYRIGSVALKNIKIGAGVWRFLDTKKMAASIESKVALGDTGISLWYSGMFHEDSNKDVEHALMALFSKNF